MRKLLFVAALAAFVLFLAPQVRSTAAQTPNASPQETPAPAAPPAAAPAPAPAGFVVVLDAAHGGTDTGARGEGMVEKDVALQMARTVRAELERQGYRVVMTRSDDSNPSYDDRAAMANARRDAIFVSLHLASTGAAGTVRAYYMQFGAPAALGATAPAANSKPATPVPAGLTPWEEAQRPYLDASHRLADLIQGELAQAFSGSPPVAAAVPVRELRSVAAPAVAVEISSVATPTPDLLTASATPLGAALGRAIAAFRQANAGGAR